MKRHLLLIASLLFVSLLGRFVQAQTPDVSFTISAVSQGPGAAVPTLTWSSTPTAASCTASGDPAWINSVATSGRITLPVVNANKNYVLACNWASDTQAVLTWGAATQNTDGTPLTDLASYKVYWNTGDPSLVTAPSGKVRSVPPALSPATTITGLSAGTWFFAVSAVNAVGVESPISNIATKTIGAATTVTKNAAILFPGTSVLTVK